MVECVICHKEEAQQKHHVSYDPAMTIEVCVKCHRRIHQHTVGVPRMKSEEEVDVEIEEELAKIRFPTLTKNIVVDGIQYIVDAESEEKLNHCLCPNGCKEYWVLYQSPSESDKNCFILKCSQCGFDLAVRRIP